MRFPNSPINQFILLLCQNPYIKNLGFPQVPKFLSVKHQPKALSAPAAASEDVRTGMQFDHLVQQTISEWKHGLYLYRFILLLMNPGKLPMPMENALYLYVFV